MTEQERYDLCVIGAGPGGYVASLRAVQLGMKVVCIEKDERLGGTCLNYGCIPSKALLDSTERYQIARFGLKEHGIGVNEVALDLARMMARKDRVVEELCENVRKLMAGNGVTLLKGYARLTGPNQVEVTRQLREDLDPDRLTVWAKAILLATGSEPVSLPHLPIDGVRIVSSTEALAFDTVPHHLLIAGGGYIGLELGSVWRRLGAEVTIVEMMPHIAGNLDGQLRRSLQRILAAQGINFLFETRVTAARQMDDGLEVTVEKKDGSDNIFCDRLLVAVGRKPFIRGLGLDTVGVQFDPKTSQVPVDDNYRTSVPSIYAIGDLIAGPMLAHKASAEGVAVVEGLAGLKAEVNYDVIPAIIYTSPEVASVGLTEEKVKAMGVEHCTGTYPFSGAGRARCTGETEGFVKFISHARTGRILGVHILGARASDVIGECVLAMEGNFTVQDFLRVVHGHPTFSEALHEAALAVNKCSIYSS